MKKNNIVDLKNVVHCYKCIKEIMAYYSKCSPSARVVIDQTLDEICDHFKELKENEAE